jgi:hypothetical protein
VIDKLSMWIAYLLPRRVVYWAAHRLIEYATTGSWRKDSGKLTASVAMQRWREGVGPDTKNDETLDTYLNCMEERGRLTGGL